MSARLAEWGIDQTAFTSALIARSEGNFLYLVKVLDAIEQGLLTSQEVRRVEDLPSGLRGYYAKHWEDMQRVHADFDQYQEPVVCFLAVARDAVSLDQLQEWVAGYWQRHAWDAGVLSRHGIRTVIDSWRQFMNVDGSGDVSASFRSLSLESSRLPCRHDRTHSVQLGHRRRGARKASDDGTWNALR